MSWLSKIFGGGTEEVVENDLPTVEQQRAAWQMHREIVDALYLDAADSTAFAEFFENGAVQRDYVNRTVLNQD